MLCSLRSCLAGQQSDLVCSALKEKKKEKKTGFHFVNIYVTWFFGWLGWFGSLVWLVGLVGWLVG